MDRGGSIIWTSGPRSDSKMEKYFFRKNGINWKAKILTQVLDIIKKIKILGNIIKNTILERLSEIR